VKIILMNMNPDEVYYTSTQRMYLYEYFVC